MNQVEAESEGNGIPLRFAFIAPALFGVSLLGAGLMTLSAGLPEDIAHAVSSLVALAAMAWLYRSFGLGFNRLGVVAVLSAVSAGVLLQAVSIGTIAIVSKIDTAATVAITLLYLLRLCVIDPVAEELCFRGVSLAALGRRGLPFWVANLIQAVLFACFHFNVVQSAYALVCRPGLGRSQTARWDRLERHRALRLQFVGAAPRLGFLLLRLAKGLEGNIGGVPSILSKVYRRVIISSKVVPQATFETDRMKT